MLTAISLLACAADGMLNLKHGLLVEMSTYRGDRAFAVSTSYLGI
jgi:hypothetical protein